MSRARESGAELWAASPSGPLSRAVALRGVGDLCAFVDELAPDAVGELVVDGPGPAGAIFVEHGRVCWAAVRGMARRLTELLVVRAGGDAASMERSYRECQREGARWGEWVVAKGILSASDLRATLFEHTLESLSVLCRRGGDVRWCARAHGGYNARFTFGTAELLVRAGASAHPELAPGLERELAMAFGEGDWGAAFVRSASSAAPEPIAARGAHPAAARELLELGKWATSSLDLAGALHHDDPMLAVEASPSRALVAFRHHGAVVVGATSPFGPARILNRRANARRGLE